MMICPHCQSSIEGPLDGNVCPECGRHFDERALEDNRPDYVATLGMAPQIGATDLPDEEPAHDKFGPTLALAPGDSSSPPSETLTPDDAEPFGETLRLASDTAAPTTPADQAPPQPAVNHTEAVSPFPHTPSPPDQPGEQTTDFQPGSHRTELIGLPTDFTPGMSIKATPPNLIGPDKLALRHFLVQPRGKKSDQPNDYTLLAGPFMGGMGKVFRAQQRSLRRDVAIKQIRDELQKVEEERGKFVTEAIITGELEHPNIIPIHDLGLVQQDADAGAAEGDIGVDLFYAMKFVEGNDWKEELPQLNEAENIDVLLKVADAISFAHSRNIIHRDLKPGNIRIGKFGEVLVMDWGLAARLDTPEGFPPAGTPIYMAPEMAIEFLQGSRKQILRQLASGPSLSPTGRTAVGKHSDIYLLGALLFQVVTGRAPHTGNSGKDCIQNAAKNKIVETDVQSELLDIALKAMATNPQDRYATVAEFQQALRSYKSHVESIALANEADADARDAEELSADGKKQAKQVYDLFSSARYGFRNALKIWSENNRARDRLRQTEQLFAETAYANDDFDLALTLLDPAMEDDQPLFQKVTRAAQEREQRVTRLKRLRRALFATILGGLIVTTCLLTILAYLGITVGTLTEEAAGLDQQNKALTEQNSELGEKNKGLAETSAGLTATNNSLQSENQSLEIQKDRLEGDVISANQEAANSKRDAESAKGEAERKGFDAKFQSAVASLLDSGPKKALESLRSIETLPAGEADWELHRLWHVSDWERSTTPIGANNTRVEFVKCSAAGDRWITGGNDANDKGTVAIWDASQPSAAKPVLLPLSGGAVSSVAISCDGRWAAVGLSGTDKSLSVWNVRVFPPEAVVQDADVAGAHRATTALAFSPSGNQLLSGGTPGQRRGGDVYLWDIDSEGQLTRQEGLKAAFEGHVDGIVRSVAFSSDGKSIVTAGDGNKVNIYKLRRADAPRSRINLELATSSKIVYAAAFVPQNAQQIVCGCSDGTAYLCELPKNGSRPSGDTLWTPATKVPLARHRDAAAVRDLAFSDDGRTLITCSGDQFVSLWDVEQIDGSLSARQRVTRRIHDAPVASCAISGNGQQAYSADTSGIAYVWTLDDVDDFVTIPPSGGADRTTMRPIHSAHMASATGVDGKPPFVVADGAGFARVVSGSPPSTPAELYVGHRNHARMTAQYIAGRNPRIVTRTPDGTACLWDLGTASLERSVSLLDQNGAPDANVFAASPDGRFLVGVANSDENAPELAASIWDVTRDNPTSFRLPNHAITALAISKLDSEGMPQLLVGHRFGLFLLWNGRWNQLLYPNNSPHRGTIRAIAIHRGEFAYVADSGRTIEDEKIVSKWSLRGVSPAFTGPAHHLPAASNTARMRLQLSQNGSALAVIQADDAGRVVDLQVLDTRDMQPAIESLAADDQAYDVQGGNVLDVAISPNGQVLLAMAAGNQLMQWDAKTKAWELHRSANQLQTIATQLRDWTESNNLTGIEFIDDARLLTYGAGIVLVWNLDSGRLEHRIQSRAPIHVAAIIPDAQGKVAAISADGRYSRWERAAGSDGNYRLVDQRLLTEFGHTCAITSPDTKQALVAVDEFGSSSSALELVELATGERTPIPTVRGRVLAMTWSGSGNRLAVAIGENGGRHISLIDANSRQSINEIPLQMPQPPTCLTLDHEGRRLAMGAGDAIYYAAESNWNQLRQGDSLGHRISAVAYSKSGRRLAIGDNGGSITLRAIDEPRAVGQEAGPTETAPDQTSVDRTVMVLPGHDAEITMLEFAEYGNNAEVLVSGDIHGKTLVHLTSDAKPRVSNPPPTAQPTDEVAP
jgi:WD40 repeat protein/serine/threonine protein kinase